MKKFDVIRSITEPKEFSDIAFAMANKAGTPEKLKELLEMEVTDDGLQTLRSVARSGNYPLSLEGQQ